VPAGEGVGHRAGGGRSAAAELGAPARAPRGEHAAQEPGAGAGGGNAYEQTRQQPAAGEQRRGADQREPPALGRARLPALAARGAKRREQPSDAAHDRGLLDGGERLPGAGDGERAGEAGERGRGGHAASASRRASASPSAARQTGRSPRQP
jgi:hypothetical protein